MVINNSLPIGAILKGSSYTYRIEKTLGQGSFGITYLASVKMEGALGAIDTNIKVAIKEFFMRDINGRADSTVTSGSKDGIYDDYKRKFRREVINLSKLHHPNIIKVIESFDANNTVYYVMEYISGGSLDDCITKHKGLKEDEAIRIIRQIGVALSFMHNNKMLHLDLKPSNIMMKESGDVVLIDFGLSKQYDFKGNPESSTKVGAGTPGYAPIEQANYREGKGFPVTMDVYALGATMFKMLTGERPPEASDILNDGFPERALSIRNIPRKLIGCIAKAMSPTKKDRYQSVDSFVGAIDSLRNEKEVSGSAVVMSAVDDSDYETKIDGVRSSKSEVEKKKVKFVFKEGNKEIPISVIKPTLILSGRSVPIIDGHYTFFGKEIYDVNKIISGSLEYRLKAGCERIDLRQIKDVCTIQVEHIFSIKISFSPYDRPKNVNFLSSVHGFFSRSGVTDILEATLPGYVEDYDYTIESKYYEYQSGRLSSLFKYLKLTPKTENKSSDNDDKPRLKTKPNNERKINDPIRDGKYTPWTLLGIGSFIAILTLLCSGVKVCDRKTVLYEAMDSDSVCVDDILPDTFDLYPLSFEDFSVKDITFTMVHLDGGTFQMGSNDGDSDEKPVHSVTLSSYYIGQTEVTQELWQAVMGSNPSNWKGETLPVETVSWEDCQTFITKLNQQTGQKFRLPTEAEWEYAARGGNKSKDYKYSGSNTIDDVAWYWENSGDSRLSGEWTADKLTANNCTPHPVATKSANELGLYDMSGNVWEWCQDWYDENYYKNSPSNNPTGPSSGSYRVYRGGSWLEYSVCCRVSDRYWNAPSFQIDDLGLRLAMSDNQDKNELIAE